MPEKLKQHVNLRRKHQETPRKRKGSCDLLGEVTGDLGRGSLHSTVWDYLSTPLFSPCSKALWDKQQYLSCAVDMGKDNIREAVESADRSITEHSFLSFFSTILWAVGNYTWEKLSWRAMPGAENENLTEAAGPCVCRAGGQIQIIIQWTFYCALCHILFLFLNLARRTPWAGLRPFSPGENKLTDIWGVQHNERKTTN